MCLLTICTSFFVRCLWVQSLFFFLIELLFFFTNF